MLIGVKRARIVAPVIMRAQGRSQWRHEHSFSTARSFSSAASSSDDDKKKKEGTSFFDTLAKSVQDTIDSNPELKKSVDELRENDSVSKTSRAFAERMRHFGDKAGDMKDSVAGKASEMKGSVSEKASQATDGFSEKFSDFKESAQEKAKDIPKPNVDMPGVDDETMKKIKSSLGGIGKTFRATQEKVVGMLPTSFAGDDKSWSDAARAVFGLRPEKGTESTIRPNESDADHEDEGDEVEEVEQMTPEEEAAAWAKAKEAAGPSLLEEQIAELASKIEKLEEERENALQDSDMALYKDLNKDIIAVRKEMETLAQRANTDAVVFVEEKKGAWEKFGDSLKDTPFFRESLARQRN